MEVKKDITTFDDIKCMTDSFYDKVRKDSLLGPVFEATIKDQWPVHLEKMYRFWETVLLEKRSYQGSPFPPHIKLAVGKKHFQQWVALFTETVDQYFEGQKAEEAKWRATKMAEMFEMKKSYFDQSGSKPLI